MTNYMSSVTHYHGEYLPHLEVKCGIYFVTFCLHDAIPTKQLMRLKVERRKQLLELDRQRLLTTGRRETVDWEYFRKIDAQLDARSSEAILGRDDIAKVVADALEFFNGDRYDLDMWVIMGTHIHVIFQLRPDNLLKKVMHSWKSFTANQINRMLGRSGEFWQADYFDRSIRCDEQLDALREYVWANPEAAGLKGWEWRRQYS